MSRAKWSITDQSIFRSLRIYQRKFLIVWHMSDPSLHKQIKNPNERSGSHHHWCVLTHRGRVTHICVSKLTIIGSDNGLSPGRRQAIIWTTAGILLIGPLGTNISEILIKIYTLSLKKMHLKMSSGKWQPSCLSLNVLNVIFNVKSCVS